MHSSFMSLFLVLLCSRQPTLVSRETSRKCNCHLGCHCVNKVLHVSLNSPQATCIASQRYNMLRRYVATSRLLISFSHLRASVWSVRHSVLMTWQQLGMLGMLRIAVNCLLYFSFVAADYFSGRALAMHFPLMSILSFLHSTPSPPMSAELRL